MTTSDVTVSVRGLTKRYGPVTAVDDLHFDVPPGAVTGFLGPNGAGKSSTLRMMLGLVRPTGGTVTYDGVEYRRLPEPSRTVGAVLDTAGFHPRHTARQHLRVYAALGGHPDSRVDAVVAALGLTEFADRPTAGYSTGMRQRLHLATALLGDPRVLLLDEPASGLDPLGIAWLRDTLRGLAAQGRTVLVSGHMLSEMEQTVDRVVLVHKGKLLAAGPITDYTTDTTLEREFLRLTTTPQGAAR